MPVTLAAHERPDRIAALIYVAAVVPIAGETIAAALRNPQWEAGTADSMTMDGISIRISPDAAAELFFHDCADSTAAAAAARLTPEPLRPALEPSPRFSIGSPTGFMMTLDDRVNPPGAQRSWRIRQYLWTTCLSWKHA